MITFSVNSPVIEHCKDLIFVWVGMPDFREQQVESKVKTGKKTVIFPAKSRTFVQNLPWKAKSPPSHIFDPNYSAFNLKCPGKY